MNSRNSQCKCVEQNKYDMDRPKESTGQRYRFEEDPSADTGFRIRVEPRTTVSVQGRWFFSYLRDRRQLRKSANRYGLQGKEEEHDQ